jgi:hypothetical protein
MPEMTWALQSRIENFLAILRWLRQSVFINLFFPPQGGRSVDQIPAGGGLFFGITAFLSFSERQKKE